MSEGYDLVELLGFEFSVWFYLVPRSRGPESSGFPAALDQATSLVAKPWVVFRVAASFCAPVKIGLL
jgi:hypothetical protein